MRVRNLSVTGEGSVEHLATVDTVYIDKPPAGQWPFALSTYLPAQQTNAAVLNSVIMRFCDPLTALVTESDYMLLCNRLSQNLIYLFINCHSGNPIDLTRRLPAPMLHSAVLSRLHPEDSTDPRAALSSSYASSGRKRGPIPMFPNPIGPSAIRRCLPQLN